MSLLHNLIADIESVGKRVYDFANPEVEMAKAEAAWKKGVADAHLALDKRVSEVEALLKAMTIPLIAPSSPAAVGVRIGGSEPAPPPAAAPFVPVGKIVSVVESGPAVEVPATAVIPATAEVAPGG